MVANNFKNYFTNYMGNFQPMDLNIFKGTMSKNMEALTAANQVWMEGMQAASRRNAEIAQNSAQKSFECIKDCSVNPNMQEMQQAHSNCMNDVIHNFTSNVREMMEMSSKASLEVYDILNKRASEAVNEMFLVCQPQKAGK